MPKNIFIADTKPSNIHIDEIKPSNMFVKDTKPLNISIGQRERFEDRLYSVTIAAGSPFGLLLTLTQRDSITVLNAKSP